MQTHTQLRYPAMLGPFLLLVFSSFTIGQHGGKGIITGKIFDENKKILPHVEIHNQTNSFFAFSDDKGQFAIKGKKGDRLVLTYSGKPVKTVIVEKVDRLNIYFDNEAKGVEDSNSIANSKNERAKRRTGSKRSTKTKVPARVETIQGVVYEGGMPLPGAEVAVKGTAAVTYTDLDGKFSIVADIGDILEFNFVGMESQTIQVNSNVINIELVSDTVTLGEVITDVYRSESRDKSRTAAHSSISISDDAEPAIRSLSGAVPGIAISTGTGEPTGDIVLREYSSATETAEPKAKGIAEGSATQTGIKAGQLTAGEVNDFSKWEYWEDLTKEKLKQWQEKWQMSPTFRYSVVLTNRDGYALVNKVVHLTDAQKTKFWTARTDNTGRAELWYKPTDLSLEKVSEDLLIVDDNNKTIIKNPKEFHEGVNTKTYNVKCNNPQKINIAFMVDATGSMGDEIYYLQAELDDVITRCKETFPQAELKMGSVFYRDQGDDYIVRNFDFTSNIDNLITFIRKQVASGGGDTPEAVVEAYEAAIDNLSWDDDAATRLLFVVLDAPAHNAAKDILKLQRLARKAAEKGIRIIPIAASDIDKSAEYLMRAMALQTNGTYLFITNHSGIGNNHIEPSTDSYTVEMLNDLILRIIIQFATVNHCDSTNEQLSVSTKIEEQLNAAAEIKLRYYPNPTKGVVTVDVDTEASSLQLFDTTGKLLFYHDKKSYQYQFDLSGFANGVYYIKVIVNEKVLMGKIIKGI